MRVLIFLVVLVLLAGNIYAQQPTRGQVQDQMQQAINELKSQITDLEKQIAEAKKNKEDTDNIKDLEEQLALLKKQSELMGGVSGKISGFSDKTIQQTAQDDNDPHVVPAKDEKRINSIPKGPLNDAALSVFVQKVVTEVEKKLSLEEKTNAKELYNELDQKEKFPDYSGKLALISWLGGSTDIAIWILGKACLDDFSNTDNLANYAALLIMAGGEHLAIPILQNLNLKFPGNTTILNNLGQAWYGLGDTNNANRYLDSTLKYFMAHPHANETKSAILEAEGNTQEAIESLKRSLKEDYTPEKEARLNKLGYQVKFEDIDFKYPIKGEPLGIEKFLNIIPDYPFEGGQAAETSRSVWQEYRLKLDAPMQKFEAEKKQILVAVDKYKKRVLDNPNLLYPYNNKIYKTAARKLALLWEWATDRLVALNKKIQAAGDSVNKWREEYNRAATGDLPCGTRIKLATAFNSKSNTLWKERNTELLNFEKEFLNSRANYARYALTDESLYEAEIITIKLEMLGYLRNLSCELEVGCLASDNPPPRTGKVLPDFDELNCQYKTELAIPHLEKYFSIKVECNKMTTKFDAKYIKGTIQENLANHTYHGNLEIQAKLGSDKQQYGPVEIGAEVKAGAGVEFTDGGIQDVYLTGKAGIKAGAAKDLGLTVAPSADLVSLEGRISVVSGKGSITGKGALSGINIK